jgi:hypothetical protein
MKTIVVGKQGRKICAFCKNWYDPCGEGIKPTKSGWEYTSRINKMCTIRHLNISSDSVACKNFESRV